MVKIILQLTIKITTFPLREWLRVQLGVIICASCPAIRLSLSQPRQAIRQTTLEESRKNGRIVVFSNLTSKIQKHLRPTCKGS